VKAQRIVWSDEASANLVLKDFISDLVHGLIEAQSPERSKFDHILKGKSRDIVVCLTGRFFVGKTMSC